MKEIQRFVHELAPCPYLHDRTARMEYLIVEEISPGEYQDLMNQGWRKFGSALFHPVCDNCRECRPIRIPVDRFVPDRSQRRAYRQFADRFEIRVGPAHVDEERLALYERYHEVRSRERGWPESHVTADEYYFSYCHNPVPGLEITAWANGRLTAILLADVTEEVLSAVYHFYEPDPALSPHGGLGTWIILESINQARLHGRRWVYLGFHVAGCRSMLYKSRFRPCELLGDNGQWHPFEGGGKPRGTG